MGKRPENLVFSSPTQLAHLSSPWVGIPSLELIIWMILNNHVATLNLSSCSWKMGMLLLPCKDWIRGHVWKTLVNKVLWLWLFPSGAPLWGPWVSIIVCWAAPLKPVLKQGLTMHSISSDLFPTCLASETYFLSKASLRCLRDHLALWFSNFFFNWKIIQNPTYKT